MRFIASGRYISAYSIHIFRITWHWCSHKMMHTTGKSKTLKQLLVSHWNIALLTRQCNKSRKNGLLWKWVIYPAQRLIEHSSRCMMTSSNGIIFRVTGPLCGEFSDHWWIPITITSGAEFDVFFELRLNKHFSKSRLRWFGTPSRSLWRQCNEWDLLADSDSELSNG